MYESGHMLSSIVAAQLRLDWGDEIITQNHPPTHHKLSSPVQTGVIGVLSWNLILVITTKLTLFDSLPQEVTVTENPIVYNEPPYSRPPPLTCSICSSKILIARF